MRRLSFAIFALIIFSTAFAQTQIPDPPKDGFVLDLTEKLTQEEIFNLNVVINDWEDSTSNELGILIMPAIEEDLSDFKVRVFEVWKIGKKNKDNGVLIIIAGNQVAIENGYGLEGRLPDITTDHIISGYMIDKLRAGDYYGALESGIEAIKTAVGDEFTADKTEEESGKSPLSLPWYCWVVMFAFFIAAEIAKRTDHLGIAILIGAIGGPIVYLMGFPITALGLVLSLPLGALCGLLGLELAVRIAIAVLTGGKAGFGGFGGGKSGGGGSIGKF